MLFRSLMFNAASLVLFFTIPAAFGLAALREPLVRILFHHGAFGGAAAANTSQCLFFFLIGAWAFAGTRLFVTIFYAFSDMNAPFRAGLISIGLNFLLCLVLLPESGYIGLALSVSAAGIVNFLILLKAVRSFVRIDGKQILFSACRAIAASVIMYFFVSVSAGVILGEQTGILMESLFVTGTVIAGIFIYLGIHMVLKSPEIEMMKNMTGKG